MRGGFVNLRSHGVNVRVNNTDMKFISKDDTIMSGLVITPILLRCRISKEEANIKM